jgi:hypothetical protein
MASTRTTYNTRRPSTPEYVAFEQPVDGIEKSDGEHGERDEIAEPLLQQPLPPLIPQEVLAVEEQAGDGDVDGGECRDEQRKGGERGQDELAAPQFEVVHFAKPPPGRR